MQLLKFKSVVGVLLGVSAVVILILGLAIPRGSVEPAPDFSAITDVNERKATFFGYLRPSIERINLEREAERNRLLGLQEKLAEGRNPNFFERRRLRVWSERYEIDTEYPEVSELVDTLLLHLDQIPESMVLAQAAMESGWGTSRFAEDGNNYFGQWCYREGCGLIPSQRTSGASHEVRVFNSAEASVRSYFRNINSHAAYDELREIRATIRETGQPLSGLKLVEGLGSYSQRGQAYIDELKSVISFNDLE